MQRLSAFVLWARWCAGQHHRIWALPDGVTDNSAAIAAAIAAAQSRGQDVFVPAGQFAYGDLILLDSVALVGTGPESVLVALDWRREAITLSGRAPEVRQVRMTGPTAPERQAAWEATRITVFGATDFAITSVTIEGSAAAGIQTAQGAKGGLLADNRISDTLSDAIHLTDGAHDIRVERNRISRAGDDGIAEVSYVGEASGSSRMTKSLPTTCGAEWCQSSVVGIFCTKTIT